MMQKWITGPKLPGDAKCFMELNPTVVEFMFNSC